MMRGDLLRHDMYPRHKLTIVAAATARCFVTTARCAAPFTHADLESMRQRLRQLPAKAMRVQWPADKTPTSEAAVLVPLVNLKGRNEAAVLFTVRSGSLREHQGEVSFPGGKHEPTDRSLVHTALRETFEEIAIPGTAVDVLGTFTPIPNKTNIMRVTPVVGFLGEVDPADVRFNDGEVAAVFALSIHQLRDPAFQTSRQLRNTRFFYNVYTAGPVEVWGLTAFILEGILNHVVPLSVSGSPPSSQTDTTTEHGVDTMSKSS